MAKDNSKNENQGPYSSILNKALEASAKKDFAGVLYTWRALAENGVLEIYARIGELYERGEKGVPKDIEEALRWYRKAVFELDDPIAHVGLGRIYFTGIDVERDIPLALKHFEKAYSRRLPEAAICLGIIYYNGIGIEKDINRAENYFKVAAEENYLFAISKLARISFDKKNYIKGTLLLLKSVILAERIARRDPDDLRLFGINIKPIDYSDRN